MADPEEKRWNRATEISAPVHNLVQGERFDNATISFFGSAPRPQLGVPALLPPSYGPYKGRNEVHETLDRLSQLGGMVQLGGVAGVGKSTTAVHYLSDNSARFQGGVFYADLGGGRTGLGESVTEALNTWLAAKGVLPSEMPSGLTARSALFRQLTAAEPVAVLIDDPAGAAQVAPLCPTSRGSVTVVTAHHEIAGIRTEHGARFLRVPMLDHAFALEVLTDLVGADRVAAEPQAFDRLAAFSEGHPLMVRVIAAELDGGRWDSAGDLAARLVDTRGRMQISGDLMASGGDYSVNAALELSVGGLTEPARTLLEGLAANPGPEFGPDLVTFLDGDSGALAGLVTAGLITVLHPAGTPRSERRWRLHALVRDFVRHTAGADLEAFGASQHRILAFYLRRTVTADRQRSSRWRCGEEFQDEPPFADRETATAWLQAEQTNLRNAVIAAFDLDHHAIAWQLCEALWGLYFWNNAFGDWIDTHQYGIESARQVGNKEAEARLLLQLGFAYYNQEDIAAARAEFTKALPVAEDSGSGRVIAAAVESIGLTDLKSGRARDALEKFDRVLALVEGDDQAGLSAVGNAQRHRARALGALGERVQAVDALKRHAIPAYEQAARTETGTDGTNDHNLARALVALGDLLVADDQADEALPVLDRAITEFGRLGNPLHGAEALASLASAYEKLGDVETAGKCLDRAAEVYEALGSLKTPEIRARRAALGSVSET